MHWRAGACTGTMLVMTGFRLRLRIAQAHWGALQSARQRLAMVAWAIGLNWLAEGLMRR